MIDADAFLRECERLGDAGVREHFLKKLWTGEQEALALAWLSRDAETKAFSMVIACPQCGSLGLATWREARRVTAEIACEIAGLSEGFIDSGCDDATGDPVILCVPCGVAVPD